MLAIVLLAAAIDNSIAAALPANATVIEEARLPAAIHPDRALVLWMRKPEKAECWEDWKELWTTMCPDSTRGCSYHGATRVSLVDTARGDLLNTIEVRDPFDGADSFAVPYVLGAGGPYRVSRSFGPPVLLWLRDYDGDGRAAEFALFDAVSCSLLLTTLIGYDPQLDRVIQYEIRGSWRDPDGKWDSTRSSWAIGLFATPAQKPGYWKYAWDAPGANHAEYEVWYRGHGVFEATVIQTEAN